MTLDQHGLNGMHPLIHGSFSINSWTVFDPAPPWESEDGEAHLYDGSIPLQVGELGTRGFWYLPGVLGPIPMDTKGNEVLRESKVTHRFQTVQVFGAPDPLIVQGSTG